MIYLTRKDIKDMATNELTFIRGEKYYLENRVKRFFFDEGAYTFFAEVEGSYDYTVKATFDRDGYLENAVCDCPAYTEYWGYCKHITAVLLKILEKNFKKEYNYIKEDEAAKNILDFFSYKEAPRKMPINIEITYEFIRNGYGLLNDTYLSMKIGEEKLYVVKSIKNLIKSIKTNDTIYYGKEFTFDPKLHCFREEDMAIIDLLTELYDNEEALLQFAYSYRNPSLFNGKKVYLSQSVIKRFFKIVKNRPFKGIIDGIIVDDLEIVHEDLQIEFFFTKEDSDLKLEVDLGKFLIPLVTDGEYVFSNNKIYRISKYQRENLKPFYKTLLKENRNVIKISQKYNDRFISEVYPIIKKIGKVKIDERVKDSIYNPGIKPEIFFDRVEEKITANIKFIYGDIIINAFNEKEKTSGSDRILLRDIAREKEVVGYFEAAEFKVSNNYIYLDDEDGIFDFVYYKLPQLQEIADVYYSESFKGLKIHDSSSFTGGVRLNIENDLLEFNFSIDGIDSSELNDVFNSIKENKKYYRLNGGSFLPLDIKELYEISKLMEYLDLDSKDFEKEMINIPKYRALYIDEHLKESNITSVKRNLKFKELVQNIKEPGDMDYKVPNNLNHILRKYQKFGFKWLKTLSGYGLGGILADDMGLGKTLQVLTFLLSEKKEKGMCPSIIIAPTSLVYNWLAEIEKFTPELRALVVTGKKEERKEIISTIEKCDIIITSYPLIRRDIYMYEGISFRYCILDEAQHIKNPVSQNAKSVKEIKANNYFALTGTPIENSLTELWSIFDFIMPGYLLNYNKFKKKYENPIVKNKDNNALLELSKHIKPFVLRRIKKDVLKELPEKIESKLIAEFTDDQKKIYLAYLQKIKGEIEEEINSKGFQRSHIKILAGLTRLRQICCHPAMFIENYKGNSGKLLLLEELIKESISSGHRILLFSQFTSMLGIIRNMLDENSVEYKYLDGSTDIKKRGHLVREFNEGKGDIFLISLKAGGTGLNLTGADTVIHFDPWWNPAVEQQATDRAYRIGQKNSVHVMKLITKGTIEEKIFRLQEKKKELIESVIKPGQTLISKLSEEEIKSIFDLEVF